VDILGIGPLELVLILVVALLVFGPDKLPEIGAKMGKGVRELRQLSREISQGVNTLTEPVDELRKPFDDAAQVVGQVSATAESLRNPGQALQNALTQQLTPASAASEAEANTISPPRSPEPAEPVDALLASTSPEAELIEPMAPVVEPSAVPALADAAERIEVDTLGGTEDNTIAPPRLPEPTEPMTPVAQPLVAPVPSVAADKLDEVVAAATADPSPTESPAQASER
jgi:TatA/E family protein of Tat protein translocase